MKTIVILIAAIQLWFIIKAIFNYISVRYAGDKLGWISFKRSNGFITLWGGKSTEDYNTTFTIGELRRTITELNRNAGSSRYLGGHSCSVLTEDHIKAGCQTIPKEEVNRVIRFVNFKTRYKLNYIN